MPLLTQAAAIREIRERTGLSTMSATERVKAMPKVLDGARQKVNRYYVELAIAEINEPPRDPSTADIRPLSAKKIARIRSFGVMPRQRA